MWVTSVSSLLELVLTREAESAKWLLFCNLFVKLKKKKSYIFSVFLVLKFLFFFALVLKWRAFLYILPNLC